MAIEAPLLFISVAEFKIWPGFDPLLFDNTTNSEENIWFAISVATSNIDYLTGFAISRKWPEEVKTSWSDAIQTATAHYVRFLCTKGSDYTRGQASMAQGGITYSESNPEDPYFIPPEVFNYLRKIKEYMAFAGFNINVKPKASFFSRFASNRGDINPLANYVQITNLISGEGIQLVKKNESNIQGTIVKIQVEDFKNLPDKIINKIKYPDIKRSSKQTISGTINQISFNLQTLEKITSTKQNKLLAGNNIIIQDNVISATAKIDPENFYTKTEINNNFETKANHEKDRSKLQTSINMLPNVIAFKELKTDRKEIINAINELYDLIKKLHNT